MFNKKVIKLIIKSFLFDNPLCNLRVKAIGSRDCWDLQKLEDFQEKKLYKSLLVANKKIPAYKNISMPKSHVEIKKFISNELPVITKDDLIKLRSEYYPQKNICMTVGRTSGTTGSPLDIFRSYNSMIWEKSFVKKHWSLSGKKLKRATLRGDEVVNSEVKSPPFWFYNNFNNQLIISSRHLKPEYMEDIINEIYQYQPTILQAYPSTAFVLAEYLEKTNQKLPVEYVYTGSEMLYPYQREMIEKNLGQVMDFYGMAERVAMATECLYGNFHINMDYSYVEILDENNMPTDEEGFLVGTTLHNSAMPLIRYKLSDRTKWKKGTCQCGSSHKMIEPISGKFEDRVFDGNGVAISPSLITFAFKGIQNIEMAQVAQIDSNVWEIRVVPSSNYSKSDNDKLESNLNEILGNTITIKVKLVEDIPRTKAGKFRWVINEYNSASN